MFKDYQVTIAKRIDITETCCLQAKDANDAATLAKEGNFASSKEKLLDMEREVLSVEEAN